jgi:hypothetical protein
VIFREFEKKRYSHSILLFFLCTIMYSITNYGGIRSPDGEVVFRAGEAFSEGTLAVEKQLPWEGFGLPRGIDGKRYSLFGPAESAFLVPFIIIAKNINKTKWYNHDMFNISPSFYIDDGLLKFITNTKLECPAKQEHALRMICSWFNIFISSIVVVLFFFIVRRMTSSSISAVTVSIVLAFGTLLWPYSGTFFSEPLAILFILLSFNFLIQNDKSFLLTDQVLSYKNIVYSGMALGMAFTTHVSAILFFPFFLLYALYLYYEGSIRFQRLYKPAFYFGMGFGIFAILHMYYNYIRFGDIFEVGRRAEIIYSHFIFPCKSLYGLLLSAGKGIFLYNPIVILSLFCYRSLQKNHKFLSMMFLGMIIFRVVFIASDSNWHGGFCLGPRHLLMIIPFLLIPIGFWIKNIIQTGNKKLYLIGFIGFCFTCMLQQIYFCIGEIFTYFHTIRIGFWNQGIDVFRNDWIYFSWKYSALYRLLELNKRGPMFLRNIEISNYILFAYFSVIFLFIMIVIGYNLLKLEKDKKLIETT